VNCPGHHFWIEEKVKFVRWRQVRQTRFVHIGYTHRGIAAICGAANSSVRIFRIIKIIAVAAARVVVTERGTHLDGRACDIWASTKHDLEMRVQHMLSTGTRGWISWSSDHPVAIAITGWRSQISDSDTAQWTTIRKAVFGFGADVDCDHPMNHCWKHLIVHVAI